MPEIKDPTHAYHLISLVAKALLFSGLTFAEAHTAFHSFLGL